MGQILHGSAKTTEAIRFEIQKIEKIKVQILCKQLQGQIKYWAVLLSLILANLSQNVKIASMYKRELAHEITDKLQKNPAVAILGPRQVGRTTLALEIGKDRPSIYLDFENPEDLQKGESSLHRATMNSQCTETSSELRIGVLFQRLSQHSTACPLQFDDAK